MSRRSLPWLIVAALVVCGIVVTALRDDDGSREPVGVIDQPRTSSSVTTVTVQSLPSSTTTTAANAHGPITATCTPNGDGSFAASFTTPWPDGHVEQGSGTIKGDGLKSIKGDRDTISYYFIKTVDGHPTCLDYN